MTHDAVRDAYDLEMRDRTAQFCRGFAVFVAMLFLVNATIELLGGAALLDAPVAGRIAGAGVMAASAVALGRRSRWPYTRALVLATVALGLVAFAAVCISNGGIVSKYAAGGPIAFAATMLLPAARRGVAVLCALFVVVLAATSTLAAQAPATDVLIASCYALGALALFTYGGAVTDRLGFEAFATNARLGAAAASLGRFLPAPVVRRVLEGDATWTDHSRRDVTILFVDMVGFTPFAERLPPEELAALLDEYLAELSGVAVARGGTVDKFVGDAIMVIFGAPDEVDGATHATRAVETALAMRAAAADLAVAWAARGVPQQLAIRVALNSGICAVGVYGSDALRSYTAIGSVPNVAARLQGEAPPNGVLASSSTWAHLGGRYEGVPTGPLALKGVLAPVEAWSIEHAVGAEEH